MKRVAFAVPGDLATATGGYAYDRRIIAELQRLGWHIDIVCLGDGFPWPSEQTGRAAAIRLAAIPANQTIVMDGLAFGVLPEVARSLCQSHPLLALVHHPLALETGLSPEHIAALGDSERTALSVASRVVVTSHTIGRQLARDYAVPPERIVAIAPGTDPAPTARGSSDGIVRLLSIGAIVPRKGFDVLIAALDTLQDLPWRLSIIGDLHRDKATVAAVIKQIDRCRLNERVALLGVVAAAELERLFADSDLFVLASHFEGYGMAYAEAIAHALPVIGTMAGAIPEAVATGTGVLVAPGDVGALAHALRRLIAQPFERAAFAAGAHMAARQLPKWRESAVKFADVLQSIGKKALA